MLSLTNTPRQRPQEISVSELPSWKTPIKSISLHLLFYVGAGVVTTGPVYLQSGHIQGNQAWV